MKKYSLRLAVAMLTMTGCLGWQGACQPLWGQVSGIDIQNISKEISPSDDFFRYVNDVWLKNTPIPDDQSDYGSFTALDIET